MFVYRENNPVMGCDPTGHWDWGGIILGSILTFIGGAAVYFGFASTEVGALVTVSVLTTGLTMIATAATDSQMVIDLSGSMGAGLFIKAGGCFVIDFKRDEVNFYLHHGEGVGKTLSIGY